MLRTIALGAALVGALWCGNAWAERYGSFAVHSDDAIQLKGYIDGGSLADFRSVLRANPSARVVLLSSGGGDVDAALEIAREIRRRGLSTAVQAGASCYSSCTYLFFAGRERVALGKIGVHRVTETASGKAAYDGDVRAALLRYGASDGVILAMARTPAGSVHVFSAAEIAKLQINTGGRQSLAWAYAAR